ncbi:hypothetical protein [Vibrio phage vB_VmeM-Yong XC32]|nr:hypothetical protein [Vibrio phage vB_VmeM-Yong XC31]QAX96559.1 hypothetical protein [Vibrio phage vB_VmeM-Yong XC32]QAX96877.1 hypothetical protein [Vibrio phage vB_VmeM-Yong MS31]QAX97182.1 hypothetical protein [Vibrio phage vB_VmeM-Yong MS32]
MLAEIEKHVVYLSPTGIRFVVTDFAWHAQDCSIRMVNYTNIEPTHDKPAFTKWVIEESLFLKQFSEPEGPTQIYPWCKSPRLSERDEQIRESLIFGDWHVSPARTVFDPKTMREGPDDVHPKELSRRLGQAQEVSSVAKEPKRQTLRRVRTGFKLVPSARKF